MVETELLQVVDILLWVAAWAMKSLYIFWSSCFHSIGWCVFMYINYINVLVYVTSFVDICSCIICIVSHVYQLTSVIYIYEAFCYICVPHLTYLCYYYIYCPKLLWTIVVRFIPELGMSMGVNKYEMKNKNIYHSYRDNQY